MLEHRFFNKLLIPAHIRSRILLVLAIVVGANYDYSALLSFIANCNTSAKCIALLPVACLICSRQLKPSATINVSADS